MAKKEYTVAQIIQILMIFGCLTLNNKLHDNTKENEVVRNQGADFLVVCTVSSCISRALTPSDFCV